MWGLASSQRALSTAEGTDPGQWRIQEEVGHHPQTDDLPSTPTA